MQKVAPGGALGAESFSGSAMMEVIPKKIGYNK